jgi:drug/metabolite transporter (DMT)-like permease
VAGGMAGGAVGQGERRRGIAMVAVSAVLWSTAGLFVRMATLDTATLVLWRSLFAALTLGGLAVARGGFGALFAVWRRPGVAALFAGTAVLSSTTYVLSLRMTTVANVMTVYAALPFIATAIGFVWMGERVTRRFLVAGVVAAGAIAGMAGASAGGHDLIGIVAALVMTTGFAIQLVAIRRYGGIDVMALNAWSAAACVPIVAPFAQMMVPEPRQIVACAFYGMLTTGFAYVLALEGGRRVTPGEAGFISMLDVVLGPLWVWLAFAERPGAAVLLGGAVVLGAVAWYLATSAAPAGSQEDIGDGMPCLAD